MIGADFLEPSHLGAGMRVLLADSGAEIACEELVRRTPRPRVWSLDARGRMLPQPLTAAYRAGKQRVFVLGLASGRQVRTSADSRLLTISGWAPLHSLQIGDRVGVPRRVPQPRTTRRMVDDEVILFAHMIGDGPCVRRQPIRYASLDEMNLTAVAKAAKHFGVTAQRSIKSAVVTTRWCHVPGVSDPRRPQWRPTTLSE